MAKKTTHDDEPYKFAQRVLEKLFVIDPNAVLAGGACRDMLEGNTINDYDFYLYTPAWTIASVVKQFSLLGIEVIKIQREKLALSGPEYAEQNKYLKWVFNAEVENRKCQFMILTERVEPKLLIEEFPLSNCKLYLQVHLRSSDINGIIVSDDYKMGKVMKCLFKTNQAYSDSNPYIRKICSRYDLPYFNSRDAATRNYFNNKYKEVVFNNQDVVVHN
jgi:hypothetical protein